MSIPPSITTPTARRRLENLRRPDKWYLADGRGAIWAPPFPVWLREPGFWDHANLYELSFGPLFSVALVTQAGAEIPMAQARRDWRPDRLVCIYQAPDGAELIETKEVLPTGRFRSSWRWQGLAQPGFLVAYSAQDPGQSSEYVWDADALGFSWAGQAKSWGDRSQACDLGLSLVASTDQGTRITGSIQRCQSSTSQPSWRLSPFQEVWEPGVGFTSAEFSPGIDDRGLDWLALAVPLRDPSGDHVSFELGARVAQSATQEAPAARTNHWHEHFDSYPSFECEDTFLERYFDYRVYGLHLCEVRGPAGHLKHSAVAEGIEYFHAPITFSGQCHMLEARWSHGPRVATGTLLNFIDNQKPDGAFHGRVYSSAMVNTDFYHANWGDALLAVDAVYGDAAFLRRGYEGLGRYFRWLLADRDPEETGTVEVHNHFETGQEYMSRYQKVNATADADGWESRTRLKGIDATVYGYQLASALEQVAARLGEPEAAAAYAQDKARIGDAILGKMWDPAIGMFSDLEPDGLERTGAKAAVCFYPMLTDLPTTEHVEAMLGHLQNKEEFGTRWPIPSSSLDDPHFDANARWQGKRHVCPWNGRVWPMTTSHIIEGLIRQWKRRHALPEQTRIRCGKLAGEMIQKFIRMMFHDQDCGRPNCFEHYNPFTGQPSEYRGIDDYQHSWVIDLMMSGVLGISVEVSTDGCAVLTIDPLPMGLKRAAVHNVIVRGEPLAVSRLGERYEVEFIGQHHEAMIGQPVVIDLAAASTEPVITDAGRLKPRPARPALTPAQKAE
ncbi:hypothetical protein OT109_10525 [Phycisphaeraceae bacterium D3-23]